METKEITSMVVAIFDVSDEKMPTVLKAGEFKDEQFEDLKNYLIVLANTQKHAEAKKEELQEMLKQLGLPNDDTVVPYYVALNLGEFLPENDATKAASYLIDYSLSPLKVKLASLIKDQLTNHQEIKTILEQMVDIYEENASDE